MPARGLHRPQQRDVFEDMVTDAGVSAGPVIGGRVDAQELAVRRGQRRPRGPFGQPQRQEREPRPLQERLDQPFREGLGVLAGVGRDEVEAGRAQQSDRPGDPVRGDGDVRVDEYQHVSLGFVREPCTRVRFAEPAGRHGAAAKYPDPAVTVGHCTGRLGGAVGGGIVIDDHFEVGERDRGQDRGQARGHPFGFVAHRQQHAHQFGHRSGVRCDPQQAGVHGGVHSEHGCGDRAHGQRPFCPAVQPCPAARPATRASGRAVGAHAAGWYCRPVTVATAATAASTVPMPIPPASATSGRSKNTRFASNDEA